MTFVFETHTFYRRMTGIIFLNLSNYSGTYFSFLLLYTVSVSTEVGKFFILIIFPHSLLYVICKAEYLTNILHTPLSSNPTILFSILSQ